MTIERMCTSLRAAAAALALGVAAAGPAQAQTLNVGDTVAVRAGDTFSGIAARITGNPARWRDLYRSGASGLANPNRLPAGSHMQLARDARGPYLRIVHGEVGRTPSTQAAPSATPTAAAAAAAVSPATLPAELVVGVLPNIAADKLVTQYESFKRYLERVNPGTRVRVIVPPNFKALFEGMQAGEYDLTVAAPNFARVAQLDRQLTPLVTYEPRTNALFVAPIESSIKGARDTRERAVAFANPQSLVAMYGQNWLKNNGLEPTRDYEVKGARTDMGVGRMLLIGEAVAAVMSNVELRSLPPEESSRLRIVEVIARIPNFVLVAGPKLDKGQQLKLKGQLRNLLADREDGAEFARQTGFSGVVDAEESMLKELDPFNAQTRRAMGVTK